MDPGESAGDGPFDGSGGESAKSEDGQNGKVKKNHGKTIQKSK
jgi:hypothetical protein